MPPLEDEIADLDANPITDYVLAELLSEEAKRLRGRARTLRDGGAGPSVDPAQQRRAAVCLEYAADIISDYVFDGTNARKDG